MSRIGKKPILIPSGVQVQLSGSKLNVQGPKGKLDVEIHPRVKITVQPTQVEVSRSTDIRIDRALHGLFRSLIQNMIIGVTEGYKKELELEGVGFKAAVKGKFVNLLLGYTHPIDYPIPEGITVVCPKPTLVTVTGTDKQMVGQVAADIRAFHKPEPYKGKGVHYVGEVIRRKQGKTVG
ncbi:MAG: 50S ribosomal protein L6 [Omnitrophica bacterium GWA2_52_12]|nr:MAG: 50S ribosomal protein L6 [Omnitrophica bacterium GWA2_52_12]